MFFERAESFKGGGMFRAQPRRIDFFIFLNFISFVADRGLYWYENSLLGSLSIVIVSVSLDLTALTASIHVLLL